MYSKYKAFQTSGSLHLQLLPPPSPTASPVHKIRYNTTYSTALVISKSAAQIMLSIHSFRHPWSIGIISQLSSYECDFIYDEIYDYLEFGYTSIGEEMRMLETMLRLYIYGMSHGSVFVRVHSRMTTMIERPSTLLQIIHQAPAAPNIIMQQPQ
jgi:hypothetical protein